MDSTGLQIGIELEVLLTPTSPPQGAAMMHADIDGDYNGGNENIEWSITDDETLQGLEDAGAGRYPPIYLKEYSSNTDTCISNAFLLHLSSYISPEPKTPTQTSLPTYLKMSDSSGSVKTTTPHKPSSGSTPTTTISPNTKADEEEEKEEAFPILLHLMVNRKRVSHIYTDPYGSYTIQSPTPSTHSHLIEIKLSSTYAQLIGVISEGIMEEMAREMVGSTLFCCNVVFSGVYVEWGEEGGGWTGIEDKDDEACRRALRRVVERGCTDVLRVDFVTMRAVK